MLVKVSHLPGKYGCKRETASHDRLCLKLNRMEQDPSECIQLQRGTNPGIHSVADLSKIGMHRLRCRVNHDAQEKPRTSPAMDAVVHAVVDHHPTAQGLHKDGITNCKVLG